jgi:hypothetical protein
MSAASSADRCPRCGCTTGKLGAGPHVASWRCARCDRWLAWVSKQVFSDMTQGDLTDALQRQADRGRGP